MATPRSVGGYAHIQLAEDTIAEIIAASNELERVLELRDTPVTVYRPLAKAIVKLTNAQRHLWDIRAIRGAKAA
jgi:hypothetical protein